MHRLRFLDLLAFELLTLLNERGDCAYVHVLSSNSKVRRADREIARAVGFDSGC